MSYIHALKYLPELARQAEETVRRVYGVRPEEIRVKGRTVRQAHARFGVWFILYRFNKFTTKDIARYYHYDHTSIIYGVRQALALGIAKELAPEAVEKPVDSNRTTPE